MAMTVSKKEEIHSLYIDDYLLPFYAAINFYKDPIYDADNDSFKNDVEMKDLKVFLSFAKNKIFRTFRIGDILGRYEAEEYNNVEYDELIEVLQEHDLIK